MPRQARLDHPGFLHHVIGRGIERRQIYMDKTDYEEFLERIETCLEKSPNRILAWALMPNHFHLLIRSGQGGISNFMRRLLTGYATYFNLRHHRAGYLFQNRFKSIVCEEEVYLKELLRYIHLNPLRGKLVKDMTELDRFPYTGHSALLGLRERKWQAVGEVLSLFGKKPERAREQYENFVSAGKGQGRRPELMGGGLKNSNGGRWPSLGQEKEAYHAQVLGSGEFVTQLLVDWEREKRDWERVRVLDIGSVGEVIAEALGVKTDDLQKPGRWQPLSKAKSIFIYVGVHYLGKSNRGMARLTHMSDPSASRASRRGEALFQELKLSERMKVIR
jgi:putative transposase